VKQILFEGKKTSITFYQEKQGNESDFIYAIEYGQFYKRYLDREEITIPFEKSKEPSPEKWIEKILETIKPLYDVGTVGEKQLFPVRIVSLYSTQLVRSEKALMLIQNYLDSIKKAQNNEDKINTICYLCRELAQLAMFANGNARAIFIFANLLLSMNGLPPFYPTNTWIFDANSMTRMVAEVTEGQKRFSRMFGTKEEFNKDLELYVTTEKLSELISTKFPEIKPINTSFKERDFNLLLRQSAEKETTLELYKFLVENRVILNIDLSYAGSIFVKALDIAGKYGDNKTYVYFLKMLSKTPYVK
jgi:hypothetical protein